MNSTELMLDFVNFFVVRDKKKRWAELAENKKVIYKKINQLERSLNDKCLFIENPKSSFLEDFFINHSPLWFWDFGDESPIELFSLDDISKNVNLRSAFLFHSKKSGISLFFNGDNQYWICKKPKKALHE